MGHIVFFVKQDENRDRIRNGIPVFQRGSSGFPGGSFVIRRSVVFPEPPRAVSDGSLVDDRSISPAPSSARPCPKKRKKQRKIVLIHEVT